MQSGFCTFRGPAKLYAVAGTTSNNHSHVMPFVDLFACNVHRPSAYDSIAVTILALLLANTDRTASPTSSL
jgi:hypothetical protein